MKHAKSDTTAASVKARAQATLAAPAKKKIAASVAAPSPTPPNPENAGESGRGPRARMHKMLLATAMEMMARGITPSIAELAEAAQVSRATAYRYFASQGDLVSAIVGESLGPVLAWQSDAPTAAERVDALFCATYPRLEEYEVPLRAAIQVSLQQMAQRRAGVPTAEKPFVRGFRIERLRNAAHPLREQLDDAGFDRVVQALSLLYGTEVFLVLKDIWQLELDDILDVVRWTAGAILQQAEREIGQAGGTLKNKRPATGKTPPTDNTSTPSQTRPARKTAPIRRTPGIGVAAKKVKKLARDAAAAKARASAVDAPADAVTARPSEPSSSTPRTSKKAAPVDKSKSGTTGTPDSAVPRAARPPTQRATTSRARRKSALATSKANTT